MEVHEGLTVTDTGNNVVCKLNKSLYGFKQVLGFKPRCWNNKFSSFLTKFSLIQTNADKCVFFGEFNGSEVYLALFVDDGIIAAKSQKVLDSIVISLSASFEITLGNGSNFVGLEISKNREQNTMFIHQSLYTKKIIQKCRMENAKGLSVPADLHTNLYPVDGDEKNETIPYREAVGSFIFLATISRPDIAFAVNNVSKFLNNHNASHWQAVKQIFAYLVNNPDLGIEYRGNSNEFELVGFSDADYANDKKTRRSTTGYVFSIAHGPVTWSC